MRLFLLDVVFHSVCSVGLLPAVRETCRDGKIKSHSTLQWICVTFPRLSCLKRSDRIRPRITTLSSQISTFHPARFSLRSSSPPRAGRQPESQSYCSFPLNLTDLSTYCTSRRMKSLLTPFSRTIGGQVSNAASKS